MYKSVASICRENICRHHGKIHALKYNVSNWLHFIQHLCLPMFILTVVANLLVLATVVACAHLRKPMNIFLCNLMVADVIACVSSVPRQLHILLTGDGRVAYTSCVVQMFWVHFFVHSEVLTLAAMSVDRYVAICRPLRYHAIVTAGRAAVATLTTNVAVVAAVSVATALVVPLKFAGDDRQIQGIYCDSMGISRLSISDTRINDLYGLALTAVFIGVPLCAIGVTYFKIILELKRSSGDFRKKSASTLTTHFLVLAVVFTSLFVTILLPRLVKDFHGPQVRNARCASQFAIFIIPIANVTIYVFRTRELREAMLRCLKQSLPKAHVHTERSGRT
ncbi:unnamed protein product [Lampetra planeri]